MAATDYARGRIAGLNEAVARLALWEKGAVGEEITFAEKAIALVTALLPPVAPTGDFLAENAKNDPAGALCADCGRTRDDHQTAPAVCGAFVPKVAPAGDREAVAYVWTDKDNGRQLLAWGKPMTDLVYTCAPLVYAALSRARTGSEARNNKDENK